MKAQMKRTSDMLAYETSLTTASHNKSITIKSEKVAGAATNPDEQAELTQPSVCRSATNRTSFFNESH